MPEFGPDGYLYLSTGDGGNANDPHDFSQNTFSLLGKVLRIDVDQREGSLEYGIPEDNPFKNKPGYRGEIWTIGMRNPWRLHWDIPSNTLFCADVGQHQKEEINLIKKGGNYGWSYREGTGSFSLKNREPSENIEFIDPVFEYGHDEGTVRGELFIGEVSTRNCTGITFLEIGEPENAGLLKWRMIKLLQKNTSNLYLMEK